MEFSNDEIEEFKNEALELLDEAERHLLSLEKGGDFARTYDAVFRVLHSLKGGAGMLNLLALQSHMHQLENHYQQCKSLKSLSKETVSYFLKGIDTSRQLLAGDKISFDYTLPENLPTQSSATPSPAKVPPAAPSTKPDTQTLKAPTSSTGATPTAKSSTSTLQQTAESLGPIKVMIIDDEVDIVENLRLLLGEAGFDSIGYTSPREALGHLKTEKPDVVLTDIKMDDLTGFDILKLINSQDPDLPVIFVSGYITKELIIEALAFGVFAAVEKPFSNLRIIELCTNAAQRYRLVKLLNNLISFIYYQYSDLEKHWKAKGGDLMHEMMQSEFRALIEAKRKLKFLRNTSNRNSGED